MSDGRSDIPGDLSDTDPEGGILETKTQKLDVRLTQTERDGLGLLAAEHCRSLGAEVRAAIDAWLQLAPWLEEVARADK